MNVQSILIDCACFVIIGAGILFLRSLKDNWYSF